MAKDIDKILDGIVVPEMEYEPKYDVTRTKAKSKNKTRATTTTAEVPEVVLPKTKAEVYAEAKGRLTQETSAVSKTIDGKRRKSAKTKTVELEIAAVTRDGENVDVEQLKLRREQLNRPIVADPVWVGTADEIVPFAWRMPLDPDIARPSKLYKQAVKEAKELLLPVPHNN